MKIIPVIYQTSYTESPNLVGFFTQNKENIKKKKKKGSPRSFQASDHTQCTLRARGSG